MNYEVVKNELLKKGFSNEQVLKVLETLKKLKEERNRRVAETLRTKKSLGLKVGRPGFKKPTFFKLICIFQELGYIDLKTITKMLNIAKSTYLKYKALEHITNQDLKSNLFKKPSEHQIELYNNFAEKYINNWLKRNRFKIRGNLIEDLKSEIKVSIYLRLPRFNDDFGTFCRNICYEVFEDFRYKNSRKEVPLDYEDGNNKKLIYNYERNEAYDV